jgi:CDP-4-dehydro-6-deoxyglucose reductase, E3
MPGRTAPCHVQDHALAGGHEWPSVRVHACGHPAMLRDARLTLQAAGLPAAHWFADAFVPSGRNDLAGDSAHNPAHDWERSGPQFDLAGIVAARERSIAAVTDIAALLRPGMSGAEARALADARLRAMGSQRNWHPTIVRFGEDTTCTSREPGDPSRRLRADDIVFIDIGPVWDGYEGDYGDTFVFGADQAHRRCAEAARAVFAEARAAWMDGASGIDLYALAETAARRHGCTLVHEMAGHRVSDFPHALYGRHKLAQAGFAPGEGLWVLEIQVRDQIRPIGAFFEDVLMRQPNPCGSATLGQ